MQTHSLKAFKELGLSDEILSSIRASHYIAPTLIQIKSIPPILEGQDLLIEAQTGSGKTACFVLPILQQLSRTENHTPNQVKFLVIVPTRELALQISGSFFRFGEFIEKKVSVLAVIGGESILQQINTLKTGVDIVIATPGRLLDLVAQNVIDLSFIKLLVIDEADKILDLGFAVELELLLQKISSVRQNLFFSATYSEKVLEIAKRISSTPKHIKIDNELPVVETIFQRVILVNKENRGMLLRHLISSEKLSNVLVFVASKVAARNLCVKLKKMGVNASAIHGDLSQSERNKALSDFKNKKSNFLIATDVAARGIDITKLSLVVNFDLPRAPADYIHRIGRTGRAGETGYAISFIGLEDLEHFKLIEKRAQLNLKREEITGFELVGNLPPKMTDNLPIKGKRKSKKDKIREKLVL